MKETNESSRIEDGSSHPMQYTLESYIHQQPISAPETYLAFDREILKADSNTFAFNFGNLSTKEKKEFIVATGNNVELFSNMLNTKTNSKSLKVTILFLHIKVIYTISYILFIDLNI